MKQWPKTVLIIFCLIFSGLSGCTSRAATGRPDPGNGTAGVPYCGSLFTTAAQYSFAELSQDIFNQPWYALPVVSDTGRKDFNPVFLAFKYTCRKGEPDPNQSLSFPALLSFKFDFVPDNFNASHPSFIFRKNPEVTAIKPTDKQAITAYRQSWEATHVIGGELIQTGSQYTGTLEVYGKNGDPVLKKTFSSPGGYFELMGKMVRAWLEYRRQPPTPGLVKELDRPMTGEMETVKWFGQAFREEWYSREEWAVYEKILTLDPGFGEVQYWYANQWGWLTGDHIKAMEGKGRAFLHHPVVAALREFSPELCSDGELNKSYAAATAYLRTILPAAPLTYYLTLKNRGRTLGQAELDAMLPVALDNPADYHLLHLLGSQYRLRNRYEIAVPLFISALSCGYQPNDGKFDLIYAALSDAFRELGYINAAGNFGLMGLNYCREERRPLLLKSLGLAFGEAFIFRKAADLLMESYTGDQRIQTLVAACLNLFLTGDRETALEWYPETWKAGGGPDKLIEARSLLARGSFKQAETLLGDYLDSGDLSPEQLLEGESIAADLYLLRDRIPQAKVHTKAAWRIAPRGRKTAFLIERAFREQEDLGAAGNYAEVAELIFKGDDFYTDLLHAVKARGYLPVDRETIINQYNYIAVQQRKWTPAEEKDFWLAGDPFAVEYLALRLSYLPEPEYKEAGIGLFIAYSKTLYNVSRYQEIHLRAFFPLLLDRLPKLEKARWMDVFEHELD